MLRKILKQITNSGFKGHLEEKGDKMLLPEVKVSLDKEILSIQEFIYKVPTKDAPEKGEEIFFIKWSYSFPTKFHEEQLESACEIASMLNKVLPLGALVYDQVDRKMRLLYTLPLKLFEEMQIDMTLHFLLHSIDTYGDLIEEMGEKNLSVNEVLAKANQM